MIFFSGLLHLIGISPLIAFIYEGYEEKNIKRGFKYVASFFILMLLAIFLLFQFKLYFVCSVPILLILFICFIKFNQEPTTHNPQLTTPLNPEQELLIKLAHTKMPFGKYEGRYLIDLPEFYIVWYHNKGFPKGALGQQLQLVYELKLNGLEELIRNIKNQYPKPN